MKTTDIKEFFNSCINDGITVERDSAIIAEWFFKTVSPALTDEADLPDLLVDENGTIKAEWAVDTFNSVVVEFPPFTEMLPVVMYFEGHRCYAKADLWIAFYFIRMVLAAREKASNEI